jgi:predicted nucleic acid-binding protein
MRIYIDASTSIALGTVGEIDLLSSFDGEIVVLPVITDEVTTEPAATSLDQFVERNDIQRRSLATDPNIEQAQSVLGESEPNGDVHLVANVLAHTAVNESVAVVSDDRRVRTVARGLDTTVTGTIGVVVRAVEEGYPSDEAKTLIRRIDDNGLHMTGELCEKADTLIDEAAE